jgi:hypothetical protein
MKYKALFFGDVYISNVPNSLVTDDLLEVIKGHDLVCCNFEAPVFTESSQPISKVGTHMKQSVAAAQLIKESGFNVINLANNHIYDYGHESLKKTLHTFKDQITVGAGLDFHSAYQLKIKEFKDFSIGFLSFCESEFGALIDWNCNRGGYAWVNHALVDNLIEQAKNKVSILIIQVHAGVEEIKIPLPEWRERYRKLILAGADAVIAHHPHVPQGWELYREKPIFYSLGNFYFDLETSEPLWNHGYGVSLTFDGSSLSEFQIIPIERSNGIVRICTDKSYSLYLQELAALLESNRYAELVNQIVLSLWNERYKSYYKTALNSVEDLSWKRILKILLKFLLIRKNRNDYLLLLHNIRIESHRWTVERALSLLEEDLNKV